MECYFTELLTRGDFLRILKERQLKIPNIDHLSDEELKRIYTTFAVPLDKREKTKNSCTNCIYSGFREKDGSSRGLKRQFELDINLSHLNLLEDGMAKRNKLNDDENINFTKRQPEDFSICNTKKMKILT